MKETIVLVEKCDKIWETLQLIKNLQSQNNDTNNDVESNIEQINDSERNAIQAPYIKYQPVLDNGNEFLPKFGLSVMAKKKLYECNICDKQYTENRSLKHHMYKIHGIGQSHKKKFKRSLPERKEIKSSTSNEDMPKETPDLEKVDTNNLDVSEETIKNLSTLYYSKIGSKRKKSNNGIFVHEQNKMMESENNNCTEIEEAQVEGKISEINMKHTDDAVNQLQKCFLCSNSYKCIIMHLERYHKIENPKQMIKKFEKSLMYSSIMPVNLDEEIKSNNGDNNDLLKKNQDPIEKNELNTIGFKRIKEREHHLLALEPSAKKIKLDTNLLTSKALSDDNFKLQQQSDIDYDTLHQKSIHKEHDEIRGTSKLLNNKNSENAVKSLSTEEKSVLTENVDSESTLNKKSIDKIVLKDENKNDKNDLRSICLCGREFRNPHTLFLHKSKCNFKINDKVSNINNLEMNDNGDNGSGIHITIKKKNNSYEIVNKDNVIGDDTVSSENSQENVISSNVTELSSVGCSGVILNDKYNEILEIPTYSKDHSIIKLVPVEEDIEVDIEDFAQNTNSIGSVSFQDSQVSSSTTLCAETVDKNDKKEDFVNNDTLTVSRSKNNKSSRISEEFSVIHTRSKTVKEHPKALCLICHSEFYSQKGYNMHLAKARNVHHIECGYCKTKLVAQCFVNHKCSIKIGHSFNGKNVNYICFYCLSTFNTIKEFDEHTISKHNDELLPYQCHKCLKRFSNEYSRNQHIREHNDDKVCGICNYKLNKNDRVSHEQYHCGLGVPCHLCKLTYLNQHNYKIHKEKEHNV
ncbi:GRIP and coiled-coil domain-containing protein-like isoform X2 [Prorops nasuta]